MGFDIGPGRPDDVFGWLLDEEPLFSPGCRWCDWISEESGPGHDKDCPNRPFNQGD